MFWLQNVVDKLAEDNSWAQGFADSINQRKDSQEHLAEEKVPEVLDITKADPSFTEFHKILGTNKRKPKIILV